MNMRGLLSLPVRVLGNFPGFAGSVGVSNVGLQIQAHYRASFAGSPITGRMSLRVYNPDGVIVSSREAFSAEQVSIDASVPKAGVYVVKGKTTDPSGLITLASDVKYVTVGTVKERYQAGESWDPSAQAYAFNQQDGRLIRF